MGVESLRYFRHRLHTREAPGIQVESGGGQVARRKCCFSNAGLLVILGLGDNVVNLVGDDAAESTPENSRLDLRPKHLDDPRASDPKKGENVAIRNRRIREACG